MDVLHAIPSIGFLTILKGILQLFILGTTGYFLHKKKLLTDCTLESLGKLLIQIFVPCLIFTKMLKGFWELPQWYIMPLASAGTIAIGALVSILFIKLCNTNKVLTGEIIAIGSFQNCGYLPMTLAIMILNAIDAQHMLIYVFFYIFGFNLLIWSVGPWLLKPGAKSLKSFLWKELFNPPVIATIISFLWVMIIGPDRFPTLMSKPLALLGNCTFPLAMIVIGGFICKYKALSWQFSKESILAIGLRLIIIPCTIMILLKFVLPQLHMWVKFILFLEAIMPSAVSIAIISNITKGDTRFVSESIFFTHIISLITIPIWFLLFQKIF